MFPVSEPKPTCMSSGGCTSGNDGEPSTRRPDYSSNLCPPKPLLFDIFWRGGAVLAFLSFLPFPFPVIADAF